MPEVQITKHYHDNTHFHKKINFKHVFWLDDSHVWKFRHPIQRMGNQFTSVCMTHVGAAANTEGRRISMRERQSRLLVTDFFCYAVVLYRKKYTHGLGLLYFVSVKLLANDGFPW